uniref:Uncharacterized protein n=1 Tax=Arundo donax TaxID=35708 RepID=A0A0A9E665_ARUDO
MCWQSSTIRTLKCEEAGTSQAFLSKAATLDLQSSLEASTSTTALLLPENMAMHSSQCPHGWFPPGEWQFSAAANILAEDVLPTPCGPWKR